jgi:hypothetical protein
MSLNLRGSYLEGFEIRLKQTYLGWIKVKNLKAIQRRSTRQGDVRLSLLKHPSKINFNPL